MDYFTRIADPNIDRINDNIYLYVDHVVAEFDCLDPIVLCEKPSDPSLIRRSDNQDIDRLPDYATLYRPRRDVNAVR